MPAMLDDPTAARITRTSCDPPYPDPHHPALPYDITPRSVTLRDRVTVATIIPFSSEHQVPRSLLAYLSDQLNKEIENGDTYPMMDGMPADQFASYWFQNFGAIMLLGRYSSAEEVVEGKDWARECLGSFYIKPNYPGRSSHVSNAGFLVTEAARNKGAGRLMGESYLVWAPRLGYVYSVFNLVYETNVASCRIWDALGFKRVGKIKGAGNLKSYPGQLIDAIIYGRDLTPEGEDFVSEERFDKIKFYLKFGKYPAGADRAEKSRLRSAATHYKLIPETDKLMLKDKEVISDPQKQYEISRDIHVQTHGGINKTTATIAEKYHWVRIKETVSMVIRNCAQCKEIGKSTNSRANDASFPVISPPTVTPSATPVPSQSVSAASRAMLLAQEHQERHQHQHQPSSDDGYPAEAGQGSVSPQVLNRRLPGNSQAPTSHAHQLHTDTHPPLQLSHEQPSAPIARMSIRGPDYIPLDPQIMEDVRHHLGSFNDDSHHHQHSDISPDSAWKDQDSFHAMISGSHVPSDHKDSRMTEVGVHHGSNDGNDGMSDDLDMLIDHEDGDVDADADADTDGNSGEFEDRDPNPRDEDEATDDDRDSREEIVMQIQAEAAQRATEDAFRGVGLDRGFSGAG
ncbi:hypothetical protein HYFRA_00003049 [Hymenoscyphus fraxineus]|uniref:Zinc finger H2C2-type histone UAS binding domain-containing protein n=1 Tax=Hymenoscyphus fraxineus TaxID=746836 RepID=A0A9N9KSL4_9HELO|nr:hypothetical protein HYFRA_00003049 [Hymenoscyphus fraxineus]